MGQITITRTTDNYFLIHIVEGDFSKQKTFIADNTEILFEKLEKILEKEIEEEKK